MRPAMSGISVSCMHVPESESERAHVLRTQIPASERGMVRSCYFAFLGFIVAVLYNLFGSLVALCAMGQGSGRLPAFFLAAVYVSAGVPGAWILW